MRGRLASAAVDERDRLVQKWQSQLRAGYRFARQKVAHAGPSASQWRDVSAVIERATLPENLRAALFTGAHAICGPAAGERGSASRADTWGAEFGLAEPRTFRAWLEGITAETERGDWRQTRAALNILAKSAAELAKSIESGEPEAAEAPHE